MRFTKTLFDDAVQAAKDDGSFKEEDATRPLRFEVTDEHVREAKPRDPCNCVLAKALCDAQPTAVAASVGVCITKIMFDNGRVLRYYTPALLKKSLRNFDATGKWDLPVGFYHFGKPGGNAKLMKNMTPEQKEKAKRRFVAFEKKLKKNGASGAGFQQHKSRAATARQINLTRA